MLCFGALGAGIESGPPIGAAICILSWRSLVTRIRILFALTFLSIWLTGSLAYGADPAQAPDPNAGKRTWRVTIYPLLVQAPVFGASVHLPSIPSLPGGGGGGGGDGESGDVSAFHRRVIERGLPGGVPCRDQSLVCGGERHVGRHLSGPSIASREREDQDTDIHRTWRGAPVQGRLGNGWCSPPQHRSGRVVGAAESGQDDRG